MMTGVSGKVTGNMTCTCNCSYTDDGKDALKPIAHIGSDPLTERGYSKAQVIMNYSVKHYGRRIFESNNMLCPECC